MSWPTWPSPIATTTSSDGKLRYHHWPAPLPDVALDTAWARWLDRPTDRQQAGGQTGRHTDRGRGNQRQGYSGRQGDRDTGRQGDTLADRHTCPAPGGCNGGSLRDHLSRCTDPVARQTDRQKAGEQTRGDTQTDRDTGNRQEGAAVACPFAGRRADTETQRQRGHGETEAGLHGQTGRQGHEQAGRHAHSQTDLSCNRWVQWWFAPRPSEPLHGPGGQTDRQRAGPTGRQGDKHTDCLSVCLPVRLSSSRWEQWWFAQRPRRRLRE